MESEDGILAGLTANKIWVEISTADATEVKSLGSSVEAKGASPADCPVSGGCNRAATGKISIFAGCKREVFERLLPVLTTLGRQVLHTGEMTDEEPKKIGFEVILEI